MMNRLLFLLLTLMIVNNPMMQAQPVDRGQKGQNDVALKTTPLKAYQWGAHSMTIRNQGTESILWNFESSEDVDAWTAIDRDGDGYNWGLCTDNGLSGQNSMVSESYLSGMGPFNPDKLLVSPQVTLSGTLSMYAQNYSSYFSDRFAVYVCVGELAQDLSNMEKISGDLIPDTHWTKYTFDLESYAGETGCIVIRHYDSFDMYWLYIDDISITYDDTPPTPERTEMPIITTEETDNGVWVTATGQGHICLYVDDLLVAEGDGTVEYVITCSDSEEMYILTATAQAEGMQISEYVYYEVVVPAMPYVVRGDADGDGKVTVNDVTALVDYLLSHDPSNINLEGADFNLDGTVSVSDVTAIVDFILGGAL